MPFVLTRKMFPGPLNLLQQNLTNARKIKTGQPLWLDHTKYGITSYGYITQSQD